MQHSSMTLEKGVLLEFDGREGASVDWVKELPEAVQAAMRARMTRTKFVDGESIFLTGARADAMYRIVSGRVEVRAVSRVGKDFLLVMYGAGHCIGVMSLIDSKPRPNDAVARGLVVADVLRAADFHSLAQDYPEIYRGMASSYAGLLRDIQRLFAGSLEERLAGRLDFLLDFQAEEADASQSNGISIALTQEMLASSVAVARQSISNILREWERLGIVRSSYGSLRVLDRARLRKLAGR